MLQNIHIDIFLMFIMDMDAQDVQDSLI